MNDGTDVAERFPPAERAPRALDAPATLLDVRALEGRIDVLLQRTQPLIDLDRADLLVSRIEKLHADYDADASVRVPRRGEELHPAERAGQVIAVVLLVGFVVVIVAGVRAALKSA